MANILTNPSLDVNTTNWSARGSATIARDTATFRTTPASLQVVTTATATGVQVANAALSIANNVKTYFGYAWVLAPAGMNGRTFLSMVYSDASTQTGAISTWVGTGAWQQVFPPNLVANGKTTTSLRIAVDNNEAVARTFNVDDALIDEFIYLPLGPVSGESRVGIIRTGRGR